MDKGTGTIVGGPATNCTNCFHCVNIHYEEDYSFGPFKSGTCTKHNIEVWEYDRCSDYEEDQGKKVNT